MWRLRRRTQRRIALLSSVLGSQILSHGVFHADPHPGNVLLLPDGRLGLIDFGQVVRLRKERQLALARLIVALADAPAPATPGATSAAGAAASLVGNDAVAEAARELGFETSRNSNEGLTALSSFFFDRDPPPVGGRGGRRRSPSQTLLALNQYDALRTIPSDIILAARVSLLLRGTAQLAASSPLSIARLWKGEAKRAIRSGRGY
jgi:aarF domain-containing kinase